MHTYIHTYMHTYIHTCIHTCKHTYTCMNAHIHTHMHECTHTYIHAYISIHTCVHQSLFLLCIRYRDGCHTPGPDLHSRHPGLRLLPPLPGVAALRDQHHRRPAIGQSRRSYVRSELISN